METKPFTETKASDFIWAADILEHLQYLLFANNEVRWAWVSSVSYGQSGLDGHWYIKVETNGRQLDPIRLPWNTTEDDTRKLAEFIRSTKPVKWTWVTLPVEEVEDDGILRLGG